MLHPIVIMLNFIGFALKRYKTKVKHFAWLLFLQLYFTLKHNKHILEANCRIDQNKPVC